MSADSERLKEGAALAKSGQFDQALSVFEGIVQSNPDDVEALFLKGACHYKLGQNTEASECWNRVLALDPNHAKARGMLEKIPATSSWDSGRGFEPSTPTPPTQPPPSTSTAQPKKKPQAKKRFDLKKVAILLVLLALVGFGADMYLNPNSYPFLKRDVVGLKWDWKPGEVLVYQGTIDESMTMSGSGGEGQSQPPIPEMTMGQTVTFDLKLNVRDVDPSGVADINASYESMNAQFNVPQVPGMGDALAGIQSVMRQAFDAAEGKTFSLRIASTGLIVECRGMEEIGQAVLEVVKGNPTMAAIGEDPSEMFSNEQTRNTFQMLLGELPVSPPSIGSAWFGSLSGQPLPSKVATLKSVEYTLAGRETVGGEECGKVSEKFEIQIDGQPNLPQLPFGEGMDFQMEASTGTGTLYFSESSQRLVRSESSIQLSLSLKMQIPGGGGGISMAMKSNSTHRLELKSIGSAASHAVESVQSGGESQGAGDKGPGGTDLKSGLSGKWFFLFEGSPSEFNFYPNGRLGVTVKREGGVTFNLDGTYEIQGDTIVFNVNTPEGPEQVKAYNAKISGPDFTFNYDDPDGPVIEAERR